MDPGPVNVSAALLLYKPEYPWGREVSVNLLVEDPDPYYKKRSDPVGIDTFMLETNFSFKSHWPTLELSNIISIKLTAISQEDPVLAKNRIQGFVPRTQGKFYK